MSLNIQYASDLHLEFPENKDFIKRHPLQPRAKILVLAGDVVPFVAIDAHRDFFSYLADNFETTYWLPGNHEYYNDDAGKRNGSFKEAVRNNVFLVNNIAVRHDDVKLILSTLWSKISKRRALGIETGLGDFRLIQYLGQRFSADLYNQLHRECLGFIVDELRGAKDESTVVFTHHCPTFVNYPEQYRYSELTEAFAVELYDLIKGSGVAYWGYGHHHSNTPTFKIGDTQLITNQLGYVRLGEHLFFEPDKVIKI